MGAVTAAGVCGTDGCITPIRCQGKRGKVLSHGATGKATACKKPQAVQHGGHTEEPLLSALCPALQPRKYLPACRLTTADGNTLHFPFI